MVEVFTEFSVFASQQFCCEYSSKSYRKNGSTHKDNQTGYTDEQTRAIEKEAVSSLRCTLNEKYGFDMSKPVSDQLVELILRLRRLRGSGGKLVE